LLVRLCLLKLATAWPRARAKFSESIGIEMKAGRVIRRVSAGLLAVAVATLLVCLDTVDYHPYFGQPYYKETTARLHAHAATNAISRGELAAGFGSALLTPTLNATQDDATQGRFHTLPLAGYGSRNGRAATGAHDDLYVKAVAL